MKLSTLNEENLRKFLEKLINDTKSGDIKWHENWDEDAPYPLSKRYFSTVLDEREAISIFPAVEGFEVSIINTSCRKFYHLDEEKTKIVFGRLCNVVDSKISAGYYEKEYKCDEFILKFISPTNNLVKN